MSIESKLWSEQVQIAIIQATAKIQCESNSSETIEDTIKALCMGLEEGIQAVRDKHYAT